jgi:hypothetical protein
MDNQTPKEKLVELLNNATEPKRPREFADLAGCTRAYVYQVAMEQDQQHKLMRRPPPEKGIRLSRRDNGSAYGTIPSSVLKHAGVGEDVDALPFTINKETGEIIIQTRKAS